jgi:hypothetical protein
MMLHCQEGLVFLLSFIALSSRKGGHMHAPPACDNYPHLLQGPALHTNLTERRKGCQGSENCALLRSDPKAGRFPCCSWRAVEDCSPVGGRYRVVFSGAFAPRWCVILIRFTTGLALAIAVIMITAAYASSSLFQKSYT